MFYLTTHSTHFIYIWLRTILIVRKETRYRHIGYSLRLTARVLLYAPSHRQDNTYHGLCCTSRGALAETRNSSMGSPHEGSIRRPIALGSNKFNFYFVFKMLQINGTETIEGSVRTYFCKDGYYNDMATLFFNSQEVGIKQLFHQSGEV